jgi:hypothetical protein
MKVGDLVRNIYTGEFLVITSEECDGGYHEVHGRWIMPKEHLEVINEQ